MSGGIKNGYKEDELSKVWKSVTSCDRRPFQGLRFSFTFTNGLPLSVTFVRPDQAAVPF